MVELKSRLLNPQEYLLDHSKRINLLNLNLLNAHSDDENEEEEVATTIEETLEEEIVETHGLWDFIFTTSENEEDKYALRVSTQSKGATHTTPTSKTPKNPNNAAKEKGMTKKPFYQSSNLLGPLQIHLLLLLFH